VRPCELVRRCARGTDRWHVTRRPRTSLTRGEDTATGTWSQATTRGTSGAEQVQWALSGASYGAAWRVRGQAWAATAAHASSTIASDVATWRRGDVAASAASSGAARRAVVSSTTCPLVSRCSPLTETVRRRNWRTGVLRRRCAVLSTKQPARWPTRTASPTATRATPSPPSRADAQSSSQPGCRRRHGRARWRPARTKRMRSPASKARTAPTITPAMHTTSGRLRRPSVDTRLGRRASASIRSAMALAASGRAGASGAPTGAPPGVRSGRLRHRSGDARSSREAAVPALLKHEGQEEDDEEDALSRVHDDPVGCVYSAGPARAGWRRAEANRP
jgi:hypothetical protein